MTETAETRKVLTPIPVDEGQIMAAERARNGANCHAIGETLENYRHWCARGVETNARHFKYMLYFLALGKTNNAQEAEIMANIHNCEILAKSPKYAGTAYGKEFEEGAEFWKQKLARRGTE